MLCYFLTNLPLHLFVFVVSTRIAELTRQELLKRHNPRVANAVVDVNPLGSAGLGENSPHWARKFTQRNQTM